MIKDIGFIEIIEIPLFINITLGEKFLHLYNINKVEQ